MIARPNIIKDAGRILFWYPFRWCVLLLPFRALYGLGRLLGWADARVSRRGRVERMTRNLAGVLGPDRDARALVEENLRTHARNNLELLKYPQLSAANIGDYVSFEGRERVDAVLREGRGVLLATAHFGAKQALQVGLGHAGFKVSQINYHMEPGELTWVQLRISQRLRKAIETSIPVTFVPADGFLRAAFECLRRGEVLIVAGDGAGIREKMTIGDGYQGFAFLGRTMYFPMGMAALARRTGAAIIPAFAVRERHRHRLVFEAPLDTSPSDDAAVIRQYVGVLETYVRRYPELWEFWEEFEPGHLLAE